MDWKYYLVKKKDNSFSAYYIEPKLATNLKN